MNTGICVRKQRIEWIDAMRGFTMFLVVYGHVGLLCFTTDDPIFNDFFMLWRMPLFFFISGFVFYKKELASTFQNVKSIIGKKFRIQVIPTLVFIIIAYKMALIDIHYEYYWFTIVLFYFFVFSVLIIWGGKLLKCSMLKYIYGTLAIAFVVSMSYSSLRPGFLNAYAGNLYLAHLNMFPYFCLGAWVKRNKNAVRKVIDHPAFLTTVQILCVAISYLMIKFYWFRNAVPYNMFFYYVAGVLGVIIVATFFRKYQSSFTRETRLGKGLQYIGRNTLDIYLLHYLFLPNVQPDISAFLTRSNNPLLEFLVSGLFALMIVGMCLLLSRLIRVNPWMGRWLFGVKY